MKTTTFPTFDDASQYLVNAVNIDRAPKSRIRQTEDGKVETLITHTDGSQEITLSPPPPYSQEREDALSSVDPADPNLEEKVKAIVERFKNVK